MTEGNPMKRRLSVLLILGVTAAVAIVASQALTHTSSTSTTAVVADPNGVPSENVDAMRRDIAKGALVLDVRKDEEWVAGRVDGSVHIPLAEVEARAGELPKGRMIVTVCKDGGRSYKAAYALRQAGYDAVNLDGGLTAWVAAGLPLSDDAGLPGHVT
jgi:rhodanese-related sulfurtransferase